MKYIYSLLLVAFICWLTYSCSNQKKTVAKPWVKVAEKVAALKKAEAFDDTSIAMAAATYPTANKTKSEIKDTSAPVTMLSMAEPKNRILELSPENFKLSLPIDGKITTLLLYRVGEPTRVLTDKDSTGITTVGQRFLTYRGKVEGQPLDSSIVSIVVSMGSISGMIITPEGKFTIGTIAGDLSGDGVVYNDTTNRPFSCGVDSAFVSNMPESLKSAQRSYNSSITADAVATKCVNWYWETDYDLFVAKGSLAATTQYIMEVWAMVSTMYANDGIPINLKTLFVWTSQDPYTGPNTNSFLAQFGDRMQTIGFNSSMGDLATLIGLQGNGGIAWIGTPCSASMYETSYCGISTYYSTLPSYSWTVEVICHEQGHNLGARHTHDCAWGPNNNERIDSCGDYAGYSSCGGLAKPIQLPVGGGTIMSYCHLTSVGINFLKGFGIQVVTRIIYNINTYFTCLSPCGSPPPPPPPNNPPVADSGPDLTITTSLTTLTGSGTDDHGIISSFWGLVSGPNTPIVAGSGYTASVSGLITGVYQFSFKAIDAGGLSDYDTMQLTVNIVGPPPPPPGTAFTDNFDRANTFVGGVANGWITVFGKWKIFNNTLKDSSIENIIIQLNTFDTVSVDLTPLASGVAYKIGIVFGYKNSSNYYVAQKETGGSALLKIYKVVNGIKTPLVSGTLSNLIGTTVKLTVTHVGGTLKATVKNGNTVLRTISINNSVFGVGQVGVYSWTNQGKPFTNSPKIDNFSAQ